MTIEERLVAGETLTGIDALVVLEKTENANWIFGAKIALAHLERGNLEQTRRILERLIAQEEAKGYRARLSLGLAFLNRGNLDQTRRGLEHLIAQEEAHDCRG